MIRRIAFAALTGLSLTIAQAAFASFEFVTTSRPAILYDAPSSASNKMAVISAGYPLEVLVRVDTWLKVRDHTGSLSWIEAASTQGKPGIIVTATTADVLEKPQYDSLTRYHVTQGVSLELAGNPSEPGWLKVRHPQGGEGYLRLQDVWGQ